LIGFALGEGNPLKLFLQSTWVHFFKFLR
ncbi:MAG: DNA-directed RNA polymerase subunit beta, partial [Lacticaseibacillus paracasei]|nr:DNA-directed RNA polymerase subunit beta [Lacticaseibacillus paracasei]